jgi:hypothetical protein
VKIIKEEKYQKIVSLFKNIESNTDNLFEGGWLTVETCKKLVQDTYYNIRCIKRILKDKI